MLKKKTLYSLNDISVVPSVDSSILSRKECDPYRPGLVDGDYYFPLIASPMSCIDIGCQEFRDEKINYIVPRTVDFSKRLSLCKTCFCAFSMSEAKELLELPETKDKIYVLIDMANGHMKEQIKLGKKLKQKFGPRISLMGGNIANPKTYLEYDKAGFDFIRVGIGGGCFLPGQIVFIKDGTKKIEDICVGDLVKTHDGTYQKVLETHTYEKNEEIYKINDIECTKNHEFYVIDVKDEGLVTDENIGEYAFWVSAENLDPKKHLLVKL